MIVSIFDIFTIGVGPSSSHTIGPMRAGKKFLGSLDKRDTFYNTKRIVVDLYGSLALTGKGHGTDWATIVGLMGFSPEEINPDLIDSYIKEIKTKKILKLNNEKEISFDMQKDIVFNYEKELSYHANAMKISALDNDDELITQKTYYSIGGGFIMSEKGLDNGKDITPRKKSLYPFKSGQELMDLCNRHHTSIAGIMMANEIKKSNFDEVRGKILNIRNVMNDCIERGCRQEGVLPGGLGVKRRAKDIYLRLKEKFNHNEYDPLTILDWVNLWAFAASEENAAGGRVVTAPTNGASGIIPAVLRYYERYSPNANQDGIIEFLLTASAVGNLFKNNASISGAEVGCQGEVGVACSMAAAGLVAAVGGTVEQVENAAEIGIEHNLGLTCDPIAGLVQVPCIERNAMGAIKAINAARLALRSDGKHTVSLDKAIETMKQTGLDMQAKYKETSKGGLAVNLVEC